MSSLYVAPPFFEQGYRISGGSIRIPVDEVDMADRLQVYRYSSNLDVSYALQLQDNLRSVQARGFPEDGFDYGSLSVLGKNDLSIVYGLVRLEAHMAVFPSNYRSINRFLASDALAEMRSLTRFLDSCGPRSKTVRGLLSRRSRSIRDVVQHASDEVQRQIDR